jgi:hypothetical protein
MSQPSEEEVAGGAGDRQCPGSSAQSPYIENIALRQRARELVARNRQLMNEINDMLLFDVVAAKDWRHARRGVS